MLEVGLSHLRYAKDAALLSSTGLYTTLGVEWITSSGFFAGLSCTYIHSLDVEVSFQLAKVRSGNVNVPDFGALNPGSNDVLEFVQLGIVSGYAF